VFWASFRCDCASSVILNTMFDSSKTVGALGGTFDHFHTGHEHFLTFASKQAEQLLIGVTNESLIREKELSSIIEPYETRIQSVRKFCEQLNIPYEIVELTDSFGPTLGQRRVDQLIVTELTTQGGELLNQRREELGLTALPISVCPMLRDESGAILTSTRIRKGQVNRAGQVYERMFSKAIILQEHQRKFFKQPLGELVESPTEIQKATMVAVVGDVCLANFVKQDWPYHLGVFDKRTKRESVTNSQVDALTIDMTASNPAGTIQPLLVRAIRELLVLFEVTAFGHRKHLFVEGEEDLVAAVLILMLPLSSRIYYGQPDQGMVEVVVTEAQKERLHQLF
jgi:pantetheine-phosphate adenylyltransferase